MKLHHILMPLTAALCAAVCVGGMSASAQENGTEPPVATGTVSIVTPLHTPNSWEKSEDGTWRYYDADGVPVTGEVTVDGQVYLFEADGTLCTGWQTVDGIRRYYDPFTALSCTGWILYHQEYYYVDAVDGKYCGVQQGLTALNGTKTNAKFLFDSYGALQLGYLTYTDGFHYYADEKTGAVVTGDIKLDGKWYRFGVDGRQATGWVTIQSNRYYFDPETGLSQTGIVKIGNDSYYITADGGMQTGYQTINGNAYYFKSGGVMLQNGKITINGVQYQADANGVLKKVEEKKQQTTSGPTPVMGTAQATAAQMQAYIRSVNPNVKQSVLDMIPYYLSEGKAEGVRGDIAFAQSCLETGNFTFAGSSVTLSQNNFCGLGVTSNGAKGNSFSTAQIGIRAQIQHLKAYASTDPLSQTCVDPRFQYVTRGCAANVEWLGIQENPKHCGWASGANYGSKILAILQAILKM